MRRLLSVLPLLIALSGPLPLPAQSAPQHPPGWIPQEVEELGQRAAFHSDFTFDKSMLQMASNFMNNADENTRRAINKLDSISVHSYHFSAPGLYDPAVLAHVRAEYSANGWQHLVSTGGKADPYRATRTDLWIGTSNLNVTGIVLMLSNPTNLDVIAFTGNLSPLDILHLRGHFGIPNFDGDRFVPAPPAGQTAPPPPPPAQTRPEYIPQQPQYAPPPPQQ